MSDHDYSLEDLVLCNQTHQREYNTVTDLRKLELSILSRNVKSYLYTQGSFASKKKCIFWSHPNDLSYEYFFVEPKAFFRCHGRKTFCSCELPIPNLLPQYSLGLVCAMYLCFLGLLSTALSYSIVQWP